MPRRRSAETIERDGRAYDLFRRGLSYRQIGAELGISHQSAYDAVRRAAKEAAVDPFEAAEARQAALDRLQDYRRSMQRILAARHYQATQGGKIVTGPDGQPLTDTGPWVSAMGQLRWIEQEDNRLRDLYPAAKTRVEVITEDAVDAECARLVQEIREREAAAVDSGAA
jgi:hypothetical protein